MLLTAMFTFLASSFPTLMKYLTAKDDRKHEKEMSEIALRQIEITQSFQVDAIRSQGEFELAKKSYEFANFKSNVKWADALVVSVRPICTYVSVILFVSLCTFLCVFWFFKPEILEKFFYRGGNMYYIFMSFREIVEAFVGFWCGGRVFGKFNQS